MMPLREALAPRKVQRFDIKELSDYVFLDMPEGCHTLWACGKGAGMAIYADCQPNRPLKKHKFRMAGTGGDLSTMSQNARYICTVFYPNSTATVHVYDLGES